MKLFGWEGNGPADVYFSKRRNRCLLVPFLGGFGGACSLDRSTFWNEITTPPLKYLYRTSNIGRFPWLVCLFKSYTLLRTPTPGPFVSHPRETSRGIPFFHVARMIYRWGWHMIPVAIASAGTVAVTCSDTGDCSEYSRESGQFYCLKGVLELDDLW